MLMISVISASSLLSGSAEPASQIAQRIEHCHVRPAHRRITDPRKEGHAGDKHALTCNLS